MGTLTGNLRESGTISRKRNHLLKNTPRKRHCRSIKKKKLIAEGMLLLFMLATQASASPVVVPGGSLVLPGHGNLLRSIMLPYYPAYPLSSRSTWTIPVRKREFSGI